MSVIYVNGIKTNCMAIGGGASTNNIFVKDADITSDSSNSDGKTSKQFTVLSGDTVILAVMHREAIASVPSGFELISESDEPLNGSQELAIYSKTFDTNYTGTFTATQENSNSRIQILVLQLEGDISISEFTKISHNVQEAYTYTLPEFSKPCLFFCHNSYANDNNYSWDFYDMFGTESYERIMLTEFIQGQEKGSRLTMFGYLGNKTINNKTVHSNSEFNEVIGIWLD